MEKNAQDEELIKLVTSMPAKVEQLLDQLQFSTALKNLEGCIEQTIYR